MSTCRKGSIATLGAVALALSSCLSINLPENLDLLPVGTAFVLRGTSALVEGPTGDPCLVWVGENGILYHLFQAVRLDNASFDAVTAPGTTSRLRLATRTDLAVDCQMGTIVEVQDVLEVVE